MSQWIEGIHYYTNEEGLVVLTEKYLLERGYCCGNGCRHCPFGHEKSARRNPGETGPSRDIKPEGRE